jgi:opacity protein-like surface antigen
MIGLACLAATAGRVYAEGEGPFLNADVGASFITGLPSGMSTDPGVRFSIVPGYRIYNDDIFGVSLQFDTGLVWNSINNSSRGDLYQVPFLVGMEYAFHTGSIVEPYIGVAGGGVYSDFNFSSRFENDQSSVNGAVQGMAGIRFRITDSAEVGVGYKFLATFPSNVDYLGTHSASVTFVIRF